MLWLLHLDKIIANAVCSKRVTGMYLFPPFNFRQRRWTNADGLVRSYPWETDSGTQRRRAGLSVSGFGQVKDWPLYCFTVHFFCCLLGSRSVSWLLHWKVWWNWQMVCFVHPPRTKQQKLEEKQADVEHKLRCLLNKPGECVTVCSTFAFLI